MRPTRYCKICGEYVADDYTYDERTLVGREVLIHIDGDRKRIFRNHKPVEDLRR